MERHTRGQAIGFLHGSCLNISSAKGRVHKKTLPASHQPPKVSVLKYAAEVPVYLLLITTVIVSLLLIMAAI